VKKYWGKIKRKLKTENINQIVVIFQNRFAHVEGMYNWYFQEVGI